MDKNATNDIFVKSFIIQTAFNLHTIISLPTVQSELAYNSQEICFSFSYHYNVRIIDMKIHICDYMHQLSVNKFLINQGFLNQARVAGAHLVS